jgi:predicted GNAT family acetyltransferase
VSGRFSAVDGVAEIVGVGTVPAYRRRGLGAAVTAALTAEALMRGVEVVFMSAGDDDVARVYRRIGFADVGTACIAAPPGTRL